MSDHKCQDILTNDRNSLKDNLRIHQKLSRNKFILYGIKNFFVFIRPFLENDQRPYPVIESSNLMFNLRALPLFPKA